MKSTQLFSGLAIITSLFIYACKEKENTPPANDKCASKNLSVTATITGSTKCENSGKIIARGNGSTGFTFQLNSGAFQSDSVFSNLATGNYTITVKDADGCTKSGSFTVAEAGTKGPLFTAVESLIATKCSNANCHGTGQDGAPRNIFDTDCKIIERKNLIKSKSVDGSMGNLTGAEKAKITDWINAGGKYTN